MKSRFLTFRFSIVLIVLLFAYGLAMYQPVREMYSPVDKLVHAAVFFLVYFAFAWAFVHWLAWKLVLLVATLGGAVELHQWMMPLYTASWEDWLADLVGISVALGLHLSSKRILSFRFAAKISCAGPERLPEAQFRSAIEALPLVSLDLVLSNHHGELLVGRRLNAPARGAWFTPGGRIRKNEPLSFALCRLAIEELGIHEQDANLLTQRSQLMGAWDHFYADSAFSSTLPTHYVNLPYWVDLNAEELQLLHLPVGDQHSHWRWLPLDEAASLVHANVQPYVAWLQDRRS